MLLGGRLGVRALAYLEFTACPPRFENLTTSLLKVSESRKEILVSSILPKNELENVCFCPSLRGQKFFVRFLGELKKPKSLFEII